MGYTRAFVGGGRSAELVPRAFIRPPSQGQPLKGHRGATSQNVRGISASKALRACEGGLGALPGLSPFLSLRDSRLWL